MCGIQFLSAGKIGLGGRDVIKKPAIGSICGPLNELEQNQNKRALTKSLKGGFFLRKKPLGSIAFGVQIF
jgi:hypothetical protein